MRKKIKKFKLVWVVIGVFLLNTNLVFAQSNISNDQEEKKITIISNLNEVKNNIKVEVEVLFNSYDEDFIKNITFEDGTKVKDYDYTIKYSPITRSSSISEYFNYAAWITRDGVISLSLDPTQQVRDNRSTKNLAWSALSSPESEFINDSRWNNTQVMKWQFDCHYGFATSKTYWNLEPHRTANSYLNVVLKGCNP